MYKATQSQDNATSSKKSSKTKAGNGKGQSNDDVTDVDFEEVKDDK